MKTKEDIIKFAKEVKKNRTEFVESEIERMTQKADIDMPWVLDNLQEEIEKRINKKDGYSDNSIYIDKLIKCYSEGNQPSIIARSYIDRVITKLIDLGFDKVARNYTYETIEGENKWYYHVSITIDIRD